MHFRKIKVGLMRIIILLLTVGLITACANSSNYANRVVKISDLEDRPSQIVSEYKIGIGDTLSINVWKNVDLGATVPVRPDGKISAPLIGDILVAGKTPEVVAIEIEGMLKKFIRAPSVAVIMTSLASTTYLSRVRVTGAVNQNVSLQHRQGMTILDAVLAAGGANEFANTQNAKLFRRQGSETIQVPFNLDSILTEGNLAENILLSPGDTITIPEKIF